MTNAVICYCLFRVALPVTLGVAIATRFNLFSLIYTLLLVVLPLLPAPTSSAIKGHTGRYLTATVAIAGLICTAHLVFQATLLGFKPYGHFLINCNDTESLFRHIGLNRLDEAYALDISRLIGVDFLVLVVSIVVLAQCKSYQRFFDERKLAAEKEKEERAEREEGSDREDRSRRDEGSDFEDYQSAFDEERKRRRREKASALINSLQNFAVVFFIAAAAIIHPSVTSALYFLSFIAVTTWWACYKKLGKAYAVYRIVLLIYSGLHFITLYLYQLPYAHHYVKPASLYARIFGLNQLTYVNCDDPRRIHFNDLSWAIFVNPILVFLLYWSLAAANRTWFATPSSKKTLDVPSDLNEATSSDISQRRKSSRRPHSRKQSAQRLLEIEPHLRRRNYKSMKRGSSAKKRTDSSMEVDPNGSIIWSSDTNPYGEGSTVTNSKFRQLLTPVISLFSVVTRQSYIATLIIMMAWGITFHSWLTFILLLWSCILWMVPNSRKACLYGSPALIIYAIALLIIQFIYGLDLTDDELPQTVESVNLGQIGLVKYRHLPVIPLAIKTLYTVMFWITLRQYMQERYMEAHRDIGEGITGQPVAISFGTSQTGMKTDYQQNGKEQRISSPLMKKIGDFIMDLLTKYWIWVVACMLMVISLGGEDVVLYRVFYMALFLFFILMFQISYKWWQKIMYGFWLTVIVYSMLVLILIYTYQFEYFPHYWENYIGISIKLQHDIGLQVYDTGTLFVQLLTPTFFLIITIIQLHYFHKNFLAISDIENYEKRKTDEEASVLQTDNAKPEESTIIIEEELGEVTSSASQAPIAEESDELKDKSTLDSDSKEKKETPESDDQKIKEETMKEMLTRWWEYIMENGFKIYDYFSNLIWRFLEVHMIKIVLFAVMALATYDVCAVHFLFVFFVVLAMPIRRIRTVLSHCCAIWASVLLLAKMIYQLSFVDKYGGWQTNCTVVENANGSLPYPFNETVGNGNWMGFTKTTDLADHCKGYIGLILVLSIQAVVKIRQHIYRIQHEEPESRTGVIFPEISRAQADIGLLKCIQYFFNYLFYKFGIEFCFVTTVACIGVRLDVYSVISAIWLCSVFLLRRRTLAKIWPFYVSYLCIFIPIQYIMAVGIPPGLCINYPWDSIMHPELRDWLYLPDFIYPPNSYKILVTFFEMLFACCQLHVFYIENSPGGEMYEGGSNKEIYYENDSSSEVIDPKLPNPVPDFVTYTTSYLDMIKVFIFFGLFWVTLAILFQAGTTRVSFFAMGYVICCFLFLWNGNDFYVKPMRVILRLWNLILVYSVCVILIKSILQVVGCVFLQHLHVNFCWLVQLLGIACLKKLQRDNTLDMDVNLQFDDQCKVPVDEAGLLWDGICFGFLLVQKRVFGSYYFQHLVTEIRAQQELSSRGAELINERLMKEVREQQAQEKKVVETIKSKMDRIRAKQQKLRGTEVVDPQTHFQGDEYSTVSTPMYSLSLSTHPDGVVLVDPHLQTVQPIQQAVSPTFGHIPSAGSVACTSSLDGYLEPNKMNMDLGFRRHPRGAVTMISPSEERSEFSPPPYPATGHAHVSLSRVNSGASSLGRALGPHHFVLPPRQRLMSISSPVPSSHFASIRSGDYYLFEDLDDDDDIDLELKKDSKSEDSDEEEDYVDVKHKGLNALLSQAMKTNIKTAAEEGGSRSGDVSEVSSLKLSRQTSVTSKPPLSQKSSLKKFPSVPEQSRPSPPDSLPLKSVKDEEGGGQPSGDDIPPTASLSDVRPDLGEQEEEPPQSLASKIKTAFKFLKVFFESVIISLTAKLNNVSKDYRYVSRKLSAEKKLLKEKYNNSDNGSVSPNSSATDKPPEEVKDPIKASTSNEEVALITLDKSSSKSDDLVLLTPDSDQEKEFQSNRPPIVLFLVAIYYSILSRSEIICYIVIVINQIKSASLLSLPLPLMVFLWGTLAVPRPNKTFWITIVTYTEAIVVMKYLFQFDFFPWNINVRYNDPFFPPRILGIEKKENYAVYDLSLLLVVFFHRFMLKSMGLWKDSPSASGSTTPAGEKDEFSEEKDIEHEKKSEHEKVDRLSSSEGANASSKEHEGDEGDLAEDEEDIDISETEEKAKFSAQALLELPKVLLSGAYGYLTPFQQFFNQVLHPDFSVTVDVYFYMILCDLLLFLIVVFGYWAFGTNTGDQGVAAYFEDNKIPVPFLIMLIIQFGLVVVDRALYLRKHILGKLIFQLVLVVFVHMWMFFILPAFNERQFTSTLPPQLWYFTKCIYFLLSAYQIRCGYPTRILGNFLCKKYNILNFCLFKGFMFVPFLYELRSLMDWIWTDTSLSVGNWFKMEDIFANIFQLKCQRRLEDEYPSPRGDPKPPLIKYGIGGLLLFIIIGIIWFPLVLFALGNTVGITNLPFDCTVQVAFGGYEPIFKMSAQHGSLVTMSQSTYDSMTFFYRADRNAQAFLANYDRKDISIVELSGASTAIWTVSPPSQQGMIDELRGKYPMTMTLTYQFSRESGADADKTVINENIITLPPNTKLRRTLARMLNGTSTDDDPSVVQIEHLIPKLLRVPGKGKPDYIAALMKGKNNFSNLSISLSRGTFHNLTSEKEWWEVSEKNRNFPFIPEKTYASIQLVAFNDKVFPSELSILSGRGIVGLYTTIVLLLGRLFRSFIAGMSYTIMFDDMPNVDRVLQLCMDIYLVRESNELALEEDLFAKLIFLYRSPETLIKWTRYSQHST